MSCKKVFIFSFCVLCLIAGTAQSQEFPTVLTCTSNAKASRDYGFIEYKWTGQKGHLISTDPAKPFEMATKAKNVKGTYLRDKVFSGLHTEKPIIRSITRFEGGVLGEWERAEEFEGHVVSRYLDSVFLIWTNNFSNPNKLWTAAVNLTKRKVTLTQVFQGATSVGGELETLDCR